MLNKFNMRVGEKLEHRNFLAIVNKLNLFFRPGLSQERPYQND